MASKDSHTTRNLGLRSDLKRGVGGVENQSQSGGEGWPGRRLNSPTHSGLSAIRVKGLPTHLQHYRNLTTLISCLIINKLPYHTSSLTSYHTRNVTRARPSLLGEDDEDNEEICLKTKSNGIQVKLQQILFYFLDSVAEVNIFTTICTEELLLDIVSIGGKNMRKTPKRHLFCVDNVAQITPGQPPGAKKGPQNAMYEWVSF